MSQLQTYGISCPTCCCLGRARPSVLICFTWPSSRVGCPLSRFLAILHTCYLHFHSTPTFIFVPALSSMVISVELSDQGQKQAACVSLCPGWTPYSRNSVWPWTDGQWRQWSPCDSLDKSELQKKLGKVRHLTGLSCAKETREMVSGQGHQPSSVVCPSCPASARLPPRCLSLLTLEVCVCVSGGGSQRCPCQSRTCWGRGG